MKILEILTFAPTDKATPYDTRPLNHPAGLHRISNALAGEEFVIDPIRLQPGVVWPGASVPDTGTMPVVNPRIGRDTFGSIRAPSMESERSRFYRNG